MTNMAIFFPIANFQSVCLLCLIFAVILKLFRGTRRNKNLPPGPRGWPVLGNVPALIRSKGKRHFHEVLAGWAQEYGGVMAVGLYPGRAASVVLSDIHSVKEALLKQEDCFLDRTVTPITEHIFTVKGSYVWESGDASKENRRFGLGALRSLGVGKKDLGHKINEEIRFLVDCFEANGNRPFDPTIHVHNAVANVTCVICFGYRFDYADPKFRKLLDTMKLIVKTAGFDAIGNAFPPLIFTPFYSELRAWVKSLDDFIIGIVQEHQHSYDPNDMRDFIDLRIAEIKRRDGISGTQPGMNAARPSTDRLIWRGLKDLFGAGTETTGNTVLWIMVYAIIHPEIQEKIQKEISDVVGSGRQPSVADRTSMPYTNAVIMEMQRWRPVAPIAVPYKTSQDAQLFGFTIPKGTSVFANLYAVLHDPMLWDRPEEFNPGRFLTEDAQPKVIAHEAFIPFGIGRRSCLGEGLAKMELFLFVTNLFQRFTFKLPAGAPPPSMVGVSGLTLAPEPFQLCAVKR